MVDLVGRGTWRNDRPVHGAERLIDGDSLMIGSSRFACRIEPPGSTSPHRSGPPALNLGVGSPASSGAANERELAQWYPPLPGQEVLDLIPAENRAPVLAWILAQVQGRREDSARRQTEFQSELVRLVSEIHRDNQTVLQRHLERAEAIQEEIATIRDEMKRRLGEPSTAPAFPASPALPRPAPLRITPAAPPENPEAAADWLIHRVNQLDQENRSSWRDLLGRISGRKDA